MDRICLRKVGRHLEAATAVAFTQVLFCSRPNIRLFEQQVFGSRIESFDRLTFDSTSTIGYSHTSCKSSSFPSKIKEEIDRNHSTHPMLCTTALMVNRSIDSAPQHNFSADGLRKEDDTKCEALQTLFRYSISNRPEHTAMTSQIRNLFGYTETQVMPSTSYQQQQQHLNSLTRHILQSTKWKKIHCHTYVGVTMPSCHAGDGCDAGNLYSEWF